VSLNNEKICREISEDKIAEQLVTKLGVSRKNILSSKTWEMKVNDIETQQTA
jgi:hypothetical protein